MTTAYMIKIILLAAFAAAAFPALGAAPGQAIATEIAEPANFMLFLSGVLGLLIGRLISRTRRGD